MLLASHQLVVMEWKVPVYELFYSGVAIARQLPPEILIYINTYWCNKSSECSLDCVQIRYIYENNWLLLITDLIHNRIATRV